MALKTARRAGIAPFIVMDVMRAANARDLAATDAAGRAIHLEVGQPGTPAPSTVRAAAKAALDSDKLGYTDAMGVPQLRARIARHYAETHSIELDPARVCVTTGSSGGFLLAFLSAFDAGDRVALADPGYPAYRNILKAIDCLPVGLPATAASRYQPTPELLDAAGGELAGLIVASPANPTGSMLSAAELAALVDWCRKRGVRFVSDEIYHGIVYDGHATTALAAGDDVFVVNSFSKYFSMTGWRIGWMVLPEAMVEPVERLAQNLFISPPSLAQVGALAAFECGAELDGNVARYARNREVLLEALPKAGIDRFAPPDGAFYLYADIGHLTNDSRAFCARMLAETGVAATPGIDFDAGRGARFMRFSFAGATGDMAEAARRIARWLG